MANKNIQMKDSNDNNLYPTVRTENLLDLTSRAELTMTNCQLYTASEKINAISYLGAVGMIEGTVKFNESLTNPVITKLPEGFRPIRTKRIGCLAKYYTPNPADTKALVYVAITPDGKVTVNDNVGKIEYLTLDNCVFPLK
ncbi:hypothetical protein [Enterococcus faecium]|uniref:hypothetical protein n=1 Tax=Enterococcus faecium TaxID=1352 RepID=UPI000764051E|nr:hypothetical protein [Enterococcus faecium]KWY14132.1 hypothetical protein AS229_11040 [Enterococcus faecium]KWY32271.1 hypothetical protein AS234_11975 [Enterococcus faecium]KWY41505.1 hypothetical protein AS236_13140 [Enterococcus faecium]KWY58111.1 hypothetical protein AS242_14250 [Enterococcus faecium]KWY77208.1 hypothetical protein AS251_13860 [Enterococcus faecium]